jgi:hypothetical protein
MRARAISLVALVGAGLLALALVLFARPTRPEGTGSVRPVDSSGEPSVLRSGPSARNLPPPPLPPTSREDRFHGPCARIEALDIASLGQRERVARLTAAALSPEEIECLDDAVRAELLEAICADAPKEASRTAVSLIIAVLAGGSDTLRATLAGNSYRDCVTEFLLGAEPSGATWATLISLWGMPSDSDWHALNSDLGKLFSRLLAQHPPSDLWWKEFSTALPESQTGLFVKFNFYTTVGKQFGSQELVPMLQRAVTWESAKTGHGTMSLVVAGEALARFVPLDQRIEITRDASTAAWARTLLTSFPGELQWPASARLSNSQALQDSIRSWLDKNWPDEDMARLLRVHILVNEWGYMGTAASRSFAEGLRDSASLTERSARVKSALEGIALAERQKESMNVAESASAALHTYLSGLDDSSLEELVRAVLNWHPVRGGRDVLIRLLTTDRRLESLNRSTYEALLAN